MKFIVKLGCSFFKDYVRYNAGDTVDLTKTTLPRYKNYVEIDMDEVPDEEETPTPETPEIEPETGEAVVEGDDAPKTRPARRRRS